MDNFLDICWEKLAAGFIFMGETLFSLLQPFHFLGPALLIFLLALVTVCITKALHRFIITKRYVELEKKFHHWVSVREEAMQCEDREKGQRMARNIDQAELNRVYYDYFFEGLLLGIARKIIPIFFVFAFINEFYRPERMLDLFGQEYVFKFGGSEADPILVGTVFWYFLCLLFSYLFWALAGRIIKRKK